MNQYEYIPEVVVWEITFACNMRCIHCGTSAGKKRPDELATEESLALIDELAGLGCKVITISGGEPLLRKDWPQLAERIKQNHMKAYLISNGNAVTPEIVQEFKRVGMSSVGISFDGTKETHNYIRQREDSFEKATNAMRLMKEAGQMFCAISQVSNINIDELDQMRDILIELGCPVWRIQMTTVTGRMHKDLVLGIERYPQLVNKMVEFKQQNTIRIDVGENICYFGCKGTELWDGNPYFGCFAGMRAVGIESNGNIKGCLSMQPQFIEGNIRDRSLTEIWNDPNGFAYNRKFTRDTAEGACHDCKYLAMCRGGCATTSVSATGCRANNPYCIYQIEQADGIEPKDNELIRELLAQTQQAAPISE